MLKPTVTPKPKPPLIIASSVKVREMQWLWFPYLPSSSASLLFGPGGIGKSHITVDIAAALTTGRPLPGQAGKRAPQKVLMLSAEDEADVVLVPRLISAGANLDMIAFPSKPFTLDTVGMRMMEEYMKEFAATIVFIDPIVHYIGGKVDMFRSNEVREVVGGIHQTAIRTQSAIILVGHTRKSQEGADYERAMGSVDFNNAVRSSLYITKTPDGDRIMRHVKSNYSKEGPSIPFSFDDDNFSWGTPFNEDPMLIAPVGHNVRAKSKALVWIKNLLKDGPVRSSEVQAAAVDEKINLKTLNRAKEGIAESQMVYEDGKIVWYWRLLSDDKPEVPSLAAKKPISALNGASKPKSRRKLVPETGDGSAGLVSLLGGRRLNAAASLGGNRL